jgi:hypothetical protein
MASFKWEPTCERFVAFIDIMGFKDKIYRENHMTILPTMQNLQQALSVINKEAILLLEGQVDDAQKDIPIKSVIRVIIFSDSILLVSLDDSYQSALKITVGANWIITNAFRNQLPIKGAIAHGLFTADLPKSLYFGRPLIDAYELQNELCFYGVVMHHSMDKHLVDKKYPRIVHHKLYSVPLKNGVVTHNVICCFDSEIKERIELAASFYGNVSGSTRRYVDNTLYFYRKLESDIKNEALKTQQ